MFIRTETLPAKGLAASGLQVGFRKDPQGVDALHPRLSWFVTTPQRGERQTAFQVLVARSQKELEQDKGSLWDSGKVISDRLSVEYAGKPLLSGTHCFWKVRVWGVAGAASQWSQHGFWSMGLLQRSEWKAQWITAPALADPANRPRTPIHCYRSEISHDPNALKSITLDLGSSRMIDRAVLAPARPQGLTWDIRSTQFPRRFRLVGADNPDFHEAKVLFDQTGSDYPGPRGNECEFKFDSTNARYVRLEVTRLGEWDADDYGVFLAQFSLYSGSQNVSVGATVSATDSIENEYWSKKFLTDGHPHVEFSRFPAAIDPKAPGVFCSSRVTMLRRDFDLEAPVRRATLYSTARGFYEARINGRRVSDDLLAPGFTDYHRRQSYETYDVTDLLHKGANTLGALLGYGWYAGHMNLNDNGYIYGYFPQLAAQLNIELADGRQLTLCTDSHWQTTLDGSLLWSDILDGEACDFRKELAGWDRPGFNASAWQPAWSQSLGAEELVAQRNAPVKVIKEMKPVSQRQLRPGVWAFDLGQEITGWVRVKAQGPAGTQITVRHTEALQPNGELNAVSLMGTPQRDDYFLDGKGPRTLEPHFTYHGFRYFEISGLTTPPKIGDVVAINIHTAVDEVGEFECSNPNFNRLMTASKWTQRNLMFDVPAGCAGRSERLAWTGDIRPCVQTALFNFDTAAFFEKYTLDLQDDQKPNGRFADISPHAHLLGTDICAGSPGWADAGVSLPWELYVNTGDTQPLAAHYESAKRWVDFIHQQNPDLIWKNARGMDWGDWLSAGQATPKELGSTAFFAHSTNLLAKMARVLGRDRDAATYETLFTGIKSAFAARYVSPEGIIRMPAVLQSADVTMAVQRLVKDGGLTLTVNNDSLGTDPAPNVLKSLHLTYRMDGKTLIHDYPEGEKVDLKGVQVVQAIYGAKPNQEADVQGSYALAVQFELLDEPLRTKAVQRLVNIIARDGGHPTTGFWSSVELTLALSSLGQHPAASQIANLTSYPSWGSMLQGDGTTFWEAFDADKQALSFNHWTHSACGEWLWRHVAGLNPDPDLPGYRGFTVRPQPSAEVSWCKASYRSVRGPIAIDWRQGPKQFTLDLLVPPGSVAKVYIPGDAATVRESDHPVDRAKGIRLLRIENGVPVYEVESGSYHFTANVSS